ncbi:hypothetical protein JK628_01295 [Shewanella sp. KX20019]|nr:hypothetical protein [Shewanella sp. KX20019]QQX80547.1 hypothetical protein JK628_01295 [Shewanella sp. KX20019]
MNSVKSDEQVLALSTGDIIYLLLGTIMLMLVMLNDWPSVIELLTRGFF